MKIFAAVALSALIAAPAFSQSNEYAPKPLSHAAAGTDQIIVKWRNGATLAKTSAPAQRASKLSSLSGVAIQHKRSSTADTDVFKLDHVMQRPEMQSVLERIQADPSVEYAVADERRWIQQLPNDPRINDQWYFLSRTTEVAATHADQAWDITTGSSSTIVAVLDTGVRYEHPDLGRVGQGGKILPGYDFVTRTDIANDGDGRDADPSDPGDWVTSADAATSAFAGCDVSTSSWHGTRVSSMIGGLTNEGNGMAGTGWSTLILPVRVLGKCGGFDSDIRDGMLWAAGVAVTGAPANPTPAKILNLSLGGNGTCNAAYQDAVNQIINKGSLIIASTGNDGQPVGTPANCNGVLSVAGIRHAGTKVGYSNLGPNTTIAAPAGNCVNTTITPTTPCVYSILAAIDSGTTTPVAPDYTDPVNRPNFGTSFSAPLVAGAAALIDAVKPQLTPLQFTAVLQQTASAFPTTSTTTTTVCRDPSVAGTQNTECICTTATCGAGMLNTFAAVQAASSTFAIAQAPSTITAGTAATIDGSASFAATARTLTAYQWSAVNVVGATPTFADPTRAVTTMQVSGSSQFTLRLTVTDSQSATDSTDVTVVTTTAPATAPSTPIGGGGGGGGSFDWVLLVLGLLPLALPGLSRRRVRVRSNRPESRYDARESGRRSHRRRRRQNFPE